MSEISSCMYCSGNNLSAMKEICKLEASTVYLLNEQGYPGRCVVSLNEHKTELFELDFDQRVKFMNDVARVAEAVKAEFGAKKINYAAYGDKVPHFHFHIVPKNEQSKNWGAPFEASPPAGSEKFLTDAEYAETIGRIARRLQ